MFTTTAVECIPRRHPDLPLAIDFATLQSVHRRFQFGPLLPVILPFLYGSDGVVLQVCRSGGPRPELGLRVQLRGERWLQICCISSDPLFEVQSWIAAKRGVAGALASLEPNPAEMVVSGAALRKPGSVRSLEELGRVRLSASFFLRDFLHSEIGELHGIPNIPDAPGLAIAAGTRLCRELLEPLQATFGRLAIRSAYRAPAVNAFGNAHGLSCASNERNYARHIWDRRDAQGAIGALATVVVPWFADRYAEGADWRAMAWWIHDHLPYSELQFFPKLAAFNIGWHERPKRRIDSFIAPRGCLTRPGMENHGGDHSPAYGFFPR